MKFFRLDLLTLLISLFILNSCKNKDTIGLGVDPATQLNGSLIDTSTIVVTTLPDKGYNDVNGTAQDSISTTYLSKTPLGYFTDPIFGTVESNIAVGLNLPGQSAYTLPTGTVTVDSAVLVLHYADGFYGDSLTSRYKVNVYQLGERPLSKVYYNTYKWNTNNLGKLVGTKSFFARTHDSIKIYNIITGAPDTLIKAAPQLRIPIDKSFINDILFYAPSSTLASNTVFKNTVKGLYLTMDKAGTTGTGGTLMFGLSDSLSVYYHSTPDGGATIDTAVVKLPLGTIHAAEIRHTPSATLKNAIADSANSNNLLYFEGLATTRVRIKFPYLKNLISSIGSNIAINRAELVITPNPGSTVPFRAQPKLTMYKYDIAHQIVELQDANPSDPRYLGVPIFGGYYSSALNSYHFVITGYVQDLVNGKTTDYGTYLAPVDTTNTSTIDINPTPQTAGRVVAVGSVTDKNSALYPYRIKLNIIYTKINK